MNESRGEILSVDRFRQLGVPLIASVAVTVALYLASRASYLLFHSMAELFSVVVAAGIFVIAWNTRHFLDNSYLLFVGIACLFIGFVDLVHTLAYRGMGVFAGAGANLPTQLWIAARYLESLTLVAAPLFLGRKVGPRLVVAGYAAVTSLLLWAIFLPGVFPDCFIEGKGLTPFKKVSEYVICLILAGSALLLGRHRAAFAPAVYRLLMGAIILTIVSELAFTFYVSVYGFSNLVGHILKIFSFYLLYKAVIETGLVRPYDLIFRSLKQSEAALAAANAELEEHVAERTADLTRANTLLQREVELHEATSARLRLANRALRTLSACNQVLVHAVDESSLLGRVCGIVVTEGGYRFAWVGYREEGEAKMVLPVVTAGEAGGYPGQRTVSWGEDVHGRGPEGTAVRERRIVVVREGECDEAFLPWQVEAGTCGVCAAIALPLADRDKVFGLLAIYASEAQAFDREEVALLREMADDLAFGICSLRTRGERELAVRALKESEEKFRTIFDNAVEGIIQTTMDGRFLTANQAAARIFGFDSPEELIAVTSDIGQQLYADPERREAFLQLLRQEGHVRAMESEFRRNDGTPLWLSVSGRAVQDAGGDILYFEGILEDITERKKLEEQLRQAQKMEAVGTLSGGVAHDFNNILTAIIGFGTLLEMKMPPDDPLLANVQQILKAADRAAALTRSLLALSRRQGLEARAVDLNQIVADIEKMLRRLIREDIELRLNLVGGELTVSADAGQIEQVLLNLTTNARDAMPAGGTITITTGTIVLDEDFRKVHGFGEPGVFALLTFADSGQGMTEDVRQRIFEPFFTTKDVGKGTGLGLSVCYGIIKQHKGYINCYSEPGRGTTFRIYLPMGRAEGRRPEAGEIASYTGGTETILVAEDDPAVRELTTTILTECGYTVIPACDGEEAVAKFAEHQDRVALCLFDVIMAKKKGWEAYEEIRKMKPDVRGLFMSGYQADTIAFSHILESAGTCFIAKPVVPRELLRRVREMLDR